MGSRALPRPLPVEYVWEEKKAGLVGRPGAVGSRFRALMDVLKDEELGLGLLDQIPVYEFRSNIILGIYIHSIIHYRWHILNS